MFTMFLRSRNIQVLGVLALVNLAICLKITNMTAPVVQDPRSDLQIHCQFDMGGEELYAVKWYKDDHEFYRYAPTGPSVYVDFPVPGVNVNKRKSKCIKDTCYLVLQELQRPYSSGSYRCEVSSEAPAFRLASRTYNITVAALPASLPSIEDMSDSYFTGEVILSSCTSDFGDPQPKLTWTINSKEVLPKYVKELPSKIEFFESNKHVNLQNRILQLNLPLDKKITGKQPSKKLEIECVSSVDGINHLVSVKRTVTITDENQLVKNQMLHWPNRTSKLVVSQFVSIILLIVLKLC